ncbi:hypothetical protein P7H22_16420 [Paenibacillus larvae]|nr:hypothetical protein [Paenibacillus larvae]MDT2241620.1 hypothetical protein [Paenibacillus larvae]
MQKCKSTTRVPPVGLIHRIHDEFLLLGGLNTHETMELSYTSTIALRQGFDHSHTSIL